MRKVSLTFRSISFVALAISAISLSIAIRPTQKVDAAKPTTIDLNATSESDIRGYYSYLNDLPESERTGQNLLKNLQYILANNPAHPSATPKTYSYAEVREIYKITDREWISSPASEIEGYDPTTGIITDFSYKNENPNLYYYYRSDNFTNPHAFDAQSTSKEGKSATMLNQEHLWSVSHGFKGDGAIPAAGTDLHHLVAADQAVNKFGHSNYTYGYVDETDSSWATNRDNWDNGDNAILGNDMGTPKNTHTLDESDNIFEPQDIDKGDVARALFYMAARYNYVGRDETQATQAEPDLLLVDYATDEDVTITCDGTNGPGKYGIVSDLLEWHKKDIVTSASNEGQYEIHRNDLIYTNYQYTRNPFIDFPLWADYIWGNKEGAADPENDPIHGYSKSGGEDVPTNIAVSFESSSIGPCESTKANVTVLPVTATNSVTWTTSDSEVATVSSSGVVQGVSDGTATITATSIKDSSVYGSATITIKTTPLTGISFSTINTCITGGQMQDVSVTFSPSNATNKNLNWSSSDTNVATVSDGKITANKAGSTVITATSVEDPSITASMKVYVTTDVNSTYIYKKVTSLDMIESGQYILFNESSGKALNAALDSGTIVATQNTSDLSEFYDSDEHTINSNDATDATAFAIGVSDNKMTIYNSTGQYYIGKETADNGIDTSDTTAYLNSYSLDASNNIVIQSDDVTSDDYTLQYYSAANCFRYYKTSQQAIQLYKCVTQAGDIIKQSFKKISSLEDATSGMYVIAASDDTNTYMMGNSFPTETASTMKGIVVTPTNDEITVADAQNNFVYIEVNGSSASVATSDRYVKYNTASGTQLISSSTQFNWTLSYSGDGLFRFTNPDATTRQLGFYKSSLAFGNYASSPNRDIYLYKYNEEKVTSYEAEDFANEFMNNIICDSTGATEPTYAQGYSWELFASRFTSLSSEDQTLLKNTEGVESSSDVKQRAMYRYDYIVNKYEYDNFIDRDVSHNKKPIDSSIDNASLIAIVTIIMSVSLVAVGVVTIKRKNKAN